MGTDDHRVIRDLLCQSFGLLNSHPDGDIPHGDITGALNTPDGVLILVAHIQDVGAAPLVNVGVQLSRSDRPSHRGDLQTSET